MVLRKDRLHRPCAYCGFSFKPTGKRSRVCDVCTAKANYERRVKLCLSAKSR